MNKISVDHEVVDGISVNRITGRLDLPGADEMEIIAQQRLSAGEQRLVLNLAGVEYISSAGLRFLLVLAKKVQSVHGIIVLCCLTPMALQVINMSGFNQLLKICETEEQAVAAAASAKE
jgi:stage II sporulation protein AA (anti-sigma F factor antagonist)